MENKIISKSNTALLVIDVQEKLFPRVERITEVLTGMQKMINGSQVFEIPILVTEQYPEGLGKTIPSLKEMFPENQSYISKTSFSSIKEPKVQKELEEIDRDHWILIGIEAHVCVLQTALDLIRQGKQVTVLNDAISSRSIFDYSTAIAEMRDFGVRISSVETILFELLQDATAPEFKQISELVKSQESCGNCCSGSCANS